jgi:hypothetical protein
MRPEQRFVHTPLEYSDTGSTQVEECGRNLGSAIILTAIRDYLDERQDVHDSAANFLFPRTDAWRSQYDWAVALADGLNPGWLRSALDRSKALWDVERCARLHGRKP